MRKIPVVGRVMQVVAKQNDRLAVHEKKMVAKNRCLKPGVAYDRFYGYNKYPSPSVY